MATPTQVWRTQHGGWSNLMSSGNPTVPIFTVIPQARNILILRTI